MRQLMGPVPEQSKCLACGERLEAALVIVGSLRCHDCRELHAPLRPELVEEERRAA